MLPLPAHQDGRGTLTVVDEVLPFPVRRVFFIHGVPPKAVRGGHRHRRNRQALICVSGRCRVRVEGAGGRSAVVLLDAPDRCLVLEPEDWHSMEQFGPGTVLLVVASHPYDPADRVEEPAP